VINGLLAKAATAPLKKQNVIYKELTDRWVSQGYWLQVVYGETYWYENTKKVTGLKVTATNRSWIPDQVSPAG
jgi:hypothetical protein